MPYVTRLRVLLPLLLVSALFVGCESPKFYQCEGQITHDGKPVPGLQIAFMPVIIDSVRTPIGLTDSAGHFRMTTGRHVGIPPGKYTVQVVDPVEADGRRTSTEADYLYVIDRYSPFKSDYIYEADRDRIEFELKLDTKEYVHSKSSEAADNGVPAAEVEAVKEKPVEQNPAEGFQQADERPPAPDVPTTHQGPSAN